MAGKVSKAPVVALVDHEEKLKALDAALTKIEKDCGKGSIMKLGDAGVNKDIEVVPTGSLSVDIALGAGGFPRGRIIEIYGPESSGASCGCGGTEERRHCSLYRCGTCFGSAICGGYRRGY